MNIVFLEADSLGEDMNLDRFFELGTVSVYGKTPLDMVPARIAEADAVIVNKIPMNEETLKHAKYLKFIGLTATGTNNVDFDYVNSRGITVTNVAGYSTDVVAQHTMAMTLYLLEHLRYYDDYVRSGAYTESKFFSHMNQQFFELAGKTWGIIGLGAIGKRVAKLAQAFGCKVIYYSASGKHKSSHYEQVEFSELLARSDVLSVHAPLTDRTRHLMNYEAFCSMKPTAIFINVARGAIVDEKDLYKALKKEKIAAAGLDVLEVEPMDKDNPLRKLCDSDRLLITPHIAWAAVEARTRLLDEVWKNIAAFQNGEERNVCTG